MSLDREFNLETIQLVAKSSLYFAWIFDNEVYFMKFQKVVKRPRRSLILLSGLKNDYSPSRGRILLELNMSSWIWATITAVIVIIIIVLIASAASRMRRGDKKSMTAKPRVTPSRVVFTTSPQTVKAGQVSGKISLEFQNIDLLAIPVPIDTLITLSSSSGGEFSINRNGMPTIKSLTILAGKHSFSFYYKDSIKGNPAITVSIPGLPEARQLQTII